MRIERPDWIGQDFYKFGYGVQFSERQGDKLNQWFDQHITPVNTKLDAQAAEIEAAKKANSGLADACLDLDVKLDAQQTLIDELVGALKKYINTPAPCDESFIYSFGEADLSDSKQAKAIKGILDLHGTTASQALKEYRERS